MHDVPDDPGHKGIPLPGTGIPGRYDVHVPLKDQRRPVPALPGPPDQPPRLVPGRLRTGKAGVGAQRVQIHRPQIDIEPEPLQPPGEVMLQLRLGGTPGDTGNGHELGEHPPDGAFVDTFQRGGFRGTQHVRLPIPIGAIPAHRRRSISQ